MHKQHLWPDFECTESDDNEDEWDEFNEDNFNPDDYVCSNYDMYKKDDPVSEIVNTANCGDLQKIKALIASGSDLNERQRWTEVTEKMGYDKSWEWFGDSALIAAARRGHVEIVAELLLNQADPMLESCPYDDIYVNALGVAKKDKIKQMISAVLELWKALNPKCSESAHYKKKKHRVVKKKPSKQSIKNALSDLL